MGVLYCLLLAVVAQQASGQGEMSLLGRYRSISMPVMNVFVLALT